jgi:uncharacterized protein (DUF2236 family)
MERPGHESRSEVFDPDGVIWRYAGDWRMTLFLGQPFFLQTCHPTVAAGVAEHSNFEADPWGRLERSFGLVLDTIYAADGPRVGAEVRAAHKTIAGFKSDGSRYHAWEPEAYFWVAATGAEGIRDFARRMGEPADREDCERFYADLRELGRRLGLREGDMPATYSAFTSWYQSILATRLEVNPTAERVLKMLSAPLSPKSIPAPLWAPLKPAGGHLTRLLTVGTLPPLASDRLGLQLDARERIQFDGICAALRLAGTAPTRLRYRACARAAFARVARRTHANSTDGA